MKNTQSSSRQLALEILCRDHPKFSQSLLDKAFLQQKLEPQEMALATELVYGVIRRRSTLEHIVAVYSHASPRQTIVKQALSMGLYQLLFLDRTPPYAAVHQTVELVKKSVPRAASYVNAVLRRVQRDIRKIEDGRETAATLPLSSHQGWQFPHPIFADPSTDLARYRAVVYSHPLFLVKRWHKQFSDGQCRELLRCGNARPPLLLRIRDHHYREVLRRQLLEQGSTVHIAGDIACIDMAGAVDKIPGFAEGKWTVQGIAPNKAVQCLSPAIGGAVLDVCAAPGGKSMHLADLVQAQGLVIACDKSLARLRLVQENSQRLGIANVCPIALDAAKLPRGFHRIFDYVLVDAPCSNSAVLARRAEARWRISAKNIHSLQQLQLSLLTAAAQTLRKGGDLVYSTCSLEPEENEQVVEHFLQNHPAFRCIERQQILPLGPYYDGGTFCKIKL